VIEGYQQHKVIAPEQIAALKDCMNLFTHRVEFQTSALFDALTEELERQSEKLDTNGARQLLDCKALLEADISGWTGRFGQSLRRRVDEAINGSRSQPSYDVSPPTIAGLSLVDEADIELDVATRVYGQRLGEKSSEDLARFSARLASLLRVAEISGNDNPFGPHVVAGATRDALQGTFAEKNLIAICLRTLTRLVAVDLAAIYRDLDQFLQQRGVAGGAASRRVERPSRPPNMPGLRNAVGNRVEDVLNDAALSEQVAAALMARVSAMNPGFRGGSMGGGLPGVPPGYLGGQGNMPAQGGVSIGGFPTLMGAPSQNFGVPTGGGIPGGFASAIAASPQLATLALLGAQLPPAMAGSVPAAMQMAAPQLLQGVGEFQSHAIGAIAQLGMPGTFPAAAPPGIAAYSTEPLRQLAASPTFAANASALDFTTIELVAMVFDYVFKDSSLAEGMKVVITHLQIPMLKAALIDRNFFANKAHPGRALLNRLAEVGARWSEDDGPNDPTYLLIRKVVDGLVRQFDRDLSLFKKAHDELEAHANSLASAAAPAETVAVERTEVEDKEITGDAIARRAIRDRLDRAPLPKYVVDFISGPWLKFTVKLAQEHGASSEPMQRALDDCDLLIESIKESMEPEARKRIISRLPKLLTDLRAGCAAVNATEIEKREFFDNMFQLHARLFKGLQVELPTSKVGQVEQVAPAKIDIELESAPEDVFREIASQMEKGMWIEMQDDVGKLKIAKLSWISPQRTTYLFTTRQGHKAASLSPVQLAEWFREDRARVLDSEPVVDRALNVMLNELVVEPR
jgi:hypothetical protein